MERISDIGFALFYLMTNHPVDCGRREADARGLARALEDRFDVYVAEDAPAATNCSNATFRCGAHRFRLPNEDGMKLIARAKSLTKPPVCMLLTPTVGGTRGRGHETRADDYIAKGRLQIDELDMRIARALRQRTLEVEKHRAASTTRHQIRWNTSW